jgi:hypothetical protein
MIKSMRVRWTGHIARMRRGGIHRGFWWERQKERDHWEELNISGRIILRWILER